MPLGMPNLRQGRFSEPRGPFQIKASFEIEDNLHALGPGTPPLAHGWSVDEESGLYCNGRCVGTLVECNVDMVQPSMSTFYSFNDANSPLSAPPMVQGRYRTLIVAILDFELYTY